MKFSSLVASAVTLLAGNTDARMGFGGCSADVGFQTIDQSRWAGTWYEIQRDILFPFEMGAECVTSVYKQNAEGGMDYYYRGYYWNMFFQYMGVGGKLSDCASGSKDTWTCKSVMNDFASSEGTMSIISTNYDRWAIQYGCLAPMGELMSMDYIWIYSRTQTLTEEEMMEIRSIIRAAVPTYNLTAIQMYSTVQDERCVYENDKFE